MKKFTLIIGILVAANILYAQDKSERIRGKARVKIEEHKDRLNLSEDQIADLKSLKEEMKPEFEKLKTNESLSRPDKMRAHANLIEEREAAVAEILDEEQLAELEVIRKEVKERRKERRENRHGDRNRHEDRKGY